MIDIFYDEPNLRMVVSYLSDKGLAIVIESSVIMVVEQINKCGKFITFLDEDEKMLTFTREDVTFVNSENTKINIFEGY